MPRRRRHRAETKFLRPQNDCRSPFRQFRVCCFAYVDYTAPGLAWAWPLGNAMRRRRFFIAGICRIGCDVGPLAAPRAAARRTMPVGFGVLLPTFALAFCTVDRCVPPGTERSRLCRGDRMWRSNTAMRRAITIGLPALAADPRPTAKSDLIVRETARLRP